MTINMLNKLSQRVNRYKLIVLVFSTTLLALHPYHISITEIYQNPESGKLEITIKIIPEDLILVLEKVVKQKLYIGETREETSTDSTVSAYLKNHFSLAVNEKQIVIKFIGKEAEPDFFWCYLESESLTTINSLKITNTVLMEMNQAQTNIVHVFIGKEKRTAYLSRDNKSKVVFIEY
jgi:hypothetical protein